MGCCGFGAAIIAKHLDRLAEQMAGAMTGDDIECVHRMRVASRRLRATLPIFWDCFGRKRYKAWMGEIKKVTKSLGEARDLDVQICFLQDSLQRFAGRPEREAIETLLSRHRELRASVQPQVVKRLRKLERSPVPEEIRDACREILKESCGPEANVEVRERAYYHVVGRLEDLLGMEGCLRDEGDKARHHEMRIKAKHLRYTLETFSDAYEGGLHEEVSAVRGFQDLLGEIHDYDVWMDYLPGFATRFKADHPQTNEAAVETGLAEFANLIGAERKARFGEFVASWEKAKEEGLFRRIRSRALNAHLGPEIIKLLEKDPRLGAIADIHGNLHALRAVMAEARKRGIKLLVNAGDSVGNGPFPSEVISMLRASRVISISGNLDRRELKRARKKGKIRGDRSVRSGNAGLTTPSITYLDMLPGSLRVELAGVSILVSHEGPGSPPEGVLPKTPGSVLRRIAKEAVADVIIIGHTHVPLVRTVDGVTFLNPGSVGKPYDGDPAASFAVLSLSPVSVEHVRLPYDISSAADSLRRSGLPENHAQGILQGLSPKDVAVEDGVLESESAIVHKQRIAIARKVAAKYIDIRGHTEQVRRLALVLFDSLGQVHGLGSVERYWLECAAILHDIGWCQGASGHNKTSLRLILDDLGLPLTSRERRIVGSIARYHRKGFPKPKHYFYHSLDRADRSRVLALSSLLRIADGLDYSHASIVRSIDVALDSGRVELSCRIRGDPTMEESQVQKKKDFFEKTFGRRILLRWETSPGPRPSAARSIRPEGHGTSKAGQ